MAEAAMRFITLSDEAYGKLIRHDVAGGEHFVQFYDDDDYLAATVSRYFAAGLDAGEPVVALTTADHGRAFTERLAALGYEVDALRARGELILLDARETLSRLMVGTMPDWQCFEAIIGEVLARARRGRDLRVRAFGEMVDLLWSDGNGAAVVALEEMWNRIAPRAPFLLFCAYGIAHFGDQADAQRLNEICRQHGHVIPAEDYTSLTSDEDRQRQIALLQQRARSLETEIRYRKELERTLREALRARACAEEELRDFVENAMYALHWVAADGTILWANQAELDLVGYARDEYVGHNITEFHVDREVILDILARLARHETLTESAARLRCKDGSIKDVVIASNVRWDDEGRFVHTRCFTRDVTEKTRAEAELRRAEAERSLALERERAARRQAEETVRYNEMFAGILGHDLRNPLSAISTGAAYLQRLDGDPRVGTAATRILLSASRMARMIDQLLDFTRIRVGNGIRIERAAADLCALCEHAKEELEAGRPEPRIAVDPAGDASGQWDADRLLQVFSNLFGNALQHGTPETQIRVEIDGTDRSRLIVSVKNGGCVAPEVLPLIFEPFRGGAKESGTMGLGLGLYITQAIVAAHGGTIEVTSTSEEGTTFRVILPRS